MATVTTKLTVSSSDLTTNALALSVSSTQSTTGSTGLARDAITSTTQKATIAVSDGDAAHGMTEGTNYIKITDAAGTIRVYCLVVTGSDASSVATGDVMVAASDIGDGTLGNDVPALGTVIAVDVNGAATTQNAVLALFKTAIEHANGHNGSITVGDVPTSADGAQEIELTNGLNMQGGIAMTETVANCTVVGTDGQVKLHTLGEFTSPSYLYVKNTSATASYYVYVYNEVNQNVVLKIAGGQFAYLPMLTTDRYMAYTSNSGTIVESMAWGTSV